MDTTINVVDAITKIDNTAISENGTKVGISNVVKTGDTTYDVILVKSEHRRTMSVYNADADKTEKLPYQEGIQMLDTLPDGRLVVQISKGKEMRVYTTISLNIGALDLSGLTWAARHKTRKPKKNAAQQEDV